MRNKLKKKSSTILWNQRKTGGGPMLDLELNPFEVKLKEVMGDTAIHGQKLSIESKCEMVRHY